MHIMWRCEFSFIEISGTLQQQGFPQWFKQATGQSAISILTSASLELPYRRFTKGRRGNQDEDQAGTLQG